MSEKRIFNFSAGPANLPDPVLTKIQNEMLNYQGSGMSVMEMSHRSSYFQDIMDKATAMMKELLDVPSDYEVLFLQGGASLQFSMIPQNLMVSGQAIQLIQTGSWTKKATKELKRFSQVDILASSEDRNFSYIPNLSDCDFNSNASFVYLCSNNTIFGTQYKKFPKTEAPLVVDMSSDILSRPLDIRQFGVIFAGAQKNVGPSGVTVVIIRRDMLDRCSDQLPSMLNYRSHVDQGSMYNTPPTFSIYTVGLVLEWLTQNGGLDRMYEINKDKADFLYQAIDDSDFFYSPTDPDSRSMMNVVFRVKGDLEDLEALFVKQAAAKGLDGLKGHRSAGGLRASIYNAHPRKGVEALVEFMHAFEKEHRLVLAQA